MAKRSEFKRKKRDYYPTPYEAIVPLLPHLPKGASFIEPCAGNGALIKHLKKHGHEYVYACDIEPQHNNDGISIAKADCLFMGFDFLMHKADFIITNPPWERLPMHEMIDAFRMRFPTWLLMDAGWMHTIQCKPYIKYCTDIVSVGRVKWIEDSKGKGKDDCCWYKFVNYTAKPIFHGPL